MKKRINYTRDEKITYYQNEVHEWTEVIDTLTEMINDETDEPIARAVNKLEQLKRRSQMRLLQLQSEEYQDFNSSLQKQLDNKKRG